MNRRAFRCFSRKWKMVEAVLFLYPIIIQHKIKLDLKSTQKFQVEPLKLALKSHVKLERDTKMDLFDNFRSFLCFMTNSVLSTQLRLIKLKSHQK